MTGYLETLAGTDKMGGKQVVHDVEDRPPDSVPTFGAVSPDDGQIVTQLERQSLIRGLSQRHVQMIAIAGAIVRNLQEPIQVEFWNMNLLRFLDLFVGNRTLPRPWRFNRYRWSAGCSFGLYVCRNNRLFHSIRAR